LTFEQHIVPMCDNVRDVSNTHTVISGSHSQLRTIQSTRTRPDPMRSDPAAVGSGRDAVGGGVLRSRIGITMERWTAVISQTEQKTVRNVPARHD